MRALLHLDPENMPGHSSPLVECIDEAHAKIVTSAGKRVTYTIQRREMKETHDVEDSRKTCNVYKMVWWQNLKRYDDRDNAQNRNQYTGWNQKSNKQMAMTSAKAYINRAIFSRLLLLLYQSVR